MIRTIALRKGFGVRDEGSVRLRQGYFACCFAVICSGLMLATAMGQESASAEPGPLDGRDVPVVSAVPESIAAALGAASETESPLAVAETPRRLTYLDGLILGVVEGITEYLPVSSTGHLILTNRVLGLDLATPMLDRDGNPIYQRGTVDARASDGVALDGSGGLPGATAAEPVGVPFTLADASNAYVIVIQGGAILAVAILYWGRLWGMAEGIFLLALWPLGRWNPALSRLATGRPQAQEGVLLARNLLAAFFPAAVIGLLLDDWIEARLFGVLPVVVALVGGSLLMLAVEHFRKRRRTLGGAEAGPDLHELSLRQCVIVGLLQCVAMWPGTSRSMMTIVGGYAVGLSPARAAEFSFLLGFITLSAASGYKLLKTGDEMLAALDFGPVLFGIAVATIAAALAVRWLVGYLTRHGLALFAWYRLALAAVVALTLLG